MKSNRCCVPPALILSSVDETRPRSSLLGQILATFGPHWPTRATLARLRQHLARFGSNSACFWTVPRSWGPRPYGDRWGRREDSQHEPIPWETLFGEPLVALLSQFVTSSAVLVPRLPQEQVIRNKTTSDNGKFDGVVEDSAGRQVVWAMDFCSAWIKEGWIGRAVDDYIPAGGLVTAVFGYVWGGQLFRGGGAGKLARGVEEGPSESSVEGFGQACRRRGHVGADRSATFAGSLAFGVRGWR